MRFPDPSLLFSLFPFAPNLLIHLNQSTIRSTLPQKPRFISNNNLFKMKQNI